MIEEREKEEKDLSFTWKGCLTMTNIKLDILSNGYLIIKI